jgi:hypothetical protein
VHRYRDKGSGRRYWEFKEIAVCVCVCVCVCVLVGYREWGSEWEGGPYAGKEVVTSELCSIQHGVKFSLDLVQFNQK